MKPLSDALCLLLSDRGHKIGHFLDVCEPYRSLQNNVETAKGNGFDTIFSGMDIGIKSKAQIEAWRQTKMRIIFFHQELISVHHSQHALAILAQWGDLENNCKSKKPHSLLVLPKSKKKDGVWDIL